MTNAFQTDLSLHFMPEIKIYNSKHKKVKYGDN